MKRVAVAVLLETSVIAAVMMHTRRTKIKGWKFLKLVKASPMALDRPDFCKWKTKKLDIWNMIVYLFEQIWNIKD